MRTRILSLLVAVLPVMVWAGVNMTQQDGNEDIPTVQDVREFRKLEVGTEARMVLLYDTVMFVGDNDIYIRGDAGAAICLRNTQFDLKKGMVLIGTLVGVRGDDNGMPLLLPSERTSDEDIKCNSTSEMEDHVYTFEELEVTEYVSDLVTVEDVILDSLDSENNARCLYAVRNNQRLPVVDRYGVSQQPLSVPAKCKSMQSILAVNGTSLFLIPVVDLSSVAIPDEVNGISNCRSTTSSKSCYDLQGRRVTGRLAAGLYIETGKKKMSFGK